jgi:hypothetical protein
MTDEPKPEIKKVDEDWKRRAAEEKAKFAPPPPPAPKAEAAGKGEGAGGAAEAPPRESPPQAGRRRGGPFEMLITMLMQQATMMLGMVPDPMTGDRYQDIQQAKILIDMLATLKAKTKGNLSPEEDRFLGAALNELQMEFVALADAMAQRGRGGKKGS